MATYNILPLALGTDYHVLARTGLLIPPLREQVDPGASVPVVRWAEGVALPARSIRTTSSTATHARTALVPTIVNNLPVTDTVPATAWAQRTHAPTTAYLSSNLAEPPAATWATRTNVPTIVNNLPVTDLIPATTWATRTLAPTPIHTPPTASEIPKTLWACTTTPPIQGQTSQITTPPAWARRTLAPSIQVSALPALVPLTSYAWHIPGVPAPSIAQPIPPAPALETTVAASWQWAVIPGRPFAEIHICTLDDLELPITSWQARIRDGSPTYLSVVTGIDYVDAIIARQGGSLKIYKGHRYLDAAGGRRLVRIIDATLHSMRYDQGARNASVTLVGYVTTTHTDPKTANLPDSLITYKSLQANGKRRLRTGVFILGTDGFQDGEQFDFALRPGDTVTFGPGALDSLQVGYIALSVSPTQEIMEIVEL